LTGFCTHEHDTCQNQDSPCRDSLARVQLASICICAFDVIPVRLSNNQLSEEFVMGQVEICTLKNSNCCFSKLFGYYSCTTILIMLIQRM